ncbi:MAG: GNAT family N-acetyltransferase [Ruminococcaceae bacterium]|nr:GNAT family N-acetyltransferase [Oscillospiraceae bacterium]
MNYLNQDPLLHITMIENLRWGWAEVLAHSPHGVAARLVQIPEPVLLVAADSPKTALELTTGIAEADVVMTCHANTAPPLAKRYGLKEIGTCYSLARFTTQPLPVPDIGAEFRVLDVSHLDAVVARYGNLHADHVRHRLAGGHILGAFLQGELAGFIGEHEEHTLGMLEVLPEYRRRHVGAALVAEKINSQLAAGRVPMGHVYVDNQVSLGMQRKLGFEVSEDVVCWIS